MIKASKKILSLVMVLCLVPAMTPLTAFAQDGCAHVHDADCGYTEGADCGNVHTHDEICGYIESADCNHVHDENCGLTTVQASVTFDIPLNEFDETWFFLTEGIPLTDEDLLGGVTAVDENGGSVTVTVKDAGGLDTQNPVPKSAVFPNEPYIITYAAEHPVSGDEFTETRELFITPGLGAIEPTAGGTTTWSGDASTIQTAVSSWADGGNVITVGSGATGTLIVPNGVTGLTINGGGNTIAGQIVMNCNSAITLTINGNLIINADSGGSDKIAISQNGTGALTLNITGTVTLNGGDATNILGDGGRGISVQASLTISGSGTLTAIGGAGGDGISGGGGGYGVYASGNINNTGTLTANGGDGGVGGSGGGSGGSGVYAGGNIINDGTLTGNGGTGGGNGVHASGNIINDGTLTATGGNGSNSATAIGGSGGDGVRASNIGSISNTGTLTATGGNGGNGGGGYAGGDGGNGVRAYGGNISNANGGTIIATGGNGGTGGGNDGGNGGNGVRADSGSIKNDGEPSDFLVSGGAGGSGSPPGANGEPISGTVDQYSNGFSNPHVIFAPTTTVNLRNPTPLVFRTGNSALLAGQSFEFVRFDALANNHLSIGFGRSLGSAEGVVYDDSSGTTGTLTIPAAAFGNHAQQPGNSALQPGDYIAEIVFKTVANVEFSYYVDFDLTDGSSGSNKSSGSGGYSPSTDDTWLERAPASTLATAAKNNGENFARTRRIGIYGVRGNAWDRLSGLRYEHDTLDGGKVQVRVTVPEPAKLTKDTRVSGYVKGSDVDSRKAFLEKRFKNKLRVIHFDHPGAWGQAMNIAAKLDLTGMDTKNLCFYYYDKATNTYKRIETPACWIDKNGYLHFTAEFAGDIVISDGALEKK